MRQCDVQRIEVPVLSALLGVDIRLCCRLRAPRVDVSGMEGQLNKVTGSDGVEAVSDAGERPYIAKIS